MTSKTITLNLPEDVYIRFQQAAQATKQSLEDVFLRAVQVGSPPNWEDAPAEFQTDLAALDRLDDGSLWHIARRRQKETDMTRYQKLLDKNRNGTISYRERERLTKLRTEADRLMLCKAHAAALLRWRGHQIPPADQL
jgi:hypothetical protein